MRSQCNPDKAVSSRSTSAWVPQESKPNPYIQKLVGKQVKSLHQKKQTNKYCLAWQMATCSEIPPHLFPLLRKVSRVTAQHGNLSLTLFLSSLLLLTRLLLLIKKHLKTQSKLGLVFVPFFLPLLYILLSLSSFCPS